METTVPGPPAEAAGSAVQPKNTPALTVPQLLAFAAFIVFVVSAILASGGKGSLVNSEELDEIRKLTLFLIAALLPSDLLVRFGRSLLFQKVERAREAAAQAPATTLAQLLAFAAFLVTVVLTLLSNQLVDTGEFQQVNEVARLLIVALLPSDAGIRFGRALYLRSQPGAPSAEQLKKV